MVESQKKLMDFILKPEMKLQATKDVPHQNYFNQEVLDEQQLLNQERNFVVVQIEADCSQIKEEQADVCISQEGELFGLKQETQSFDEEPPQVKEEQEELCSSQQSELLIVKLEADTFMVTPISEQSEAEPNSEQLFSYNSAITEIQDEEGSQHVDWGSTKEEEPKPKKRRFKERSHHEDPPDAPQLHGCKEEVITEELCISQKEECFGPKQETEPFMVTPTDEDSDNSETDSNSQHLLSHNSPDTESQKSSRSSMLSIHERIHTEPPQVKQEQEELEPLQVKEEQEELCSSQESELLMVKLEANTFMVTPIFEQTVTEPNSEQLLSDNSAVTEIQDEEGSWHVNSRSTKGEEPKPKKRQLTTRNHHEDPPDAPQLHGCKEEVITEELCISQKEECFGPKQKTDPFIVTPTDEDSDNSESDSVSTSSLTILLTMRHKNSAGGACYQFMREFTQVRSCFLVK
ncbi:uncharacterized protein KZ484_016254 [Pholidichthys leucotaenia]